MKKLLFFLCFFYCALATAQRMTREILQVNELERCVLSSDEVFKVSVRTHTGPEVVIITRAEGEYFNDIRLDSRVDRGTLTLTSLYKEILQDGYDKLSAHKVFSMELELEIPEGMRIEINSNVASVYLNGQYEHALIQLKNGSCYLEKFEGDAVINTYEGNILGNAKNFDAEATTRHGKLQLPSISYGNHKMVLTSINGNIKLSETK